MGTVLPHLELTCFGPPHVRVDGAEPAPEVVWRKHLALLVYLALSPETTRSREHLLGLLWPEKPQDKARHSLNEALRRLRARLGDTRLTSGGDRVRLSPDALDVDALRCERLATTDPAAAMALLRGEFLEGFGLDDAPSFEDWLTAQRTRWRTLGVSLLLRAGENALAGSRFEDARAAGERALTLEPTAETAANLVMRAFALAGDASGALAAYRQFQDRVRADIGEEPGRELRDLSDRIRAGRWRRLSSRFAGPEPPLVGRADLYQEVFEILDASLKRSPRCLVILGDQGMGKTRLMGECRRRLELAGAATVTARPLESDADVPWSMLRLLLRGGLREISGAAATDPGALAVLSALELEGGGAQRTAMALGTSDVVAALRSLLGATADEQPVGILIDDAEFADGPSVDAVSAAVAQMSIAGVVLVVSAGAGSDTGPRELWRLMSEVGRSVGGTAVQLDPLSAEDMRTLTAELATWCQEPRDLDRLARRLTFETGGNPFLAVTLLQELDRTSHLRSELLEWPPTKRTFESPLPIAVPQLARTAFLRRIGELGEEQRRVLCAASICGSGLDTGLLAALADSSADRVETVLEQLEERQLVTFDGRRYAFAAGLIAKIVRAECLTPGRRQRLRRRAIEWLATHHDLESRVLSVELRARVEPGADTLETALEVARLAMEAGSDRAVRRALFAAERAAAEADPAGRERVAAMRSSLDTRDHRRPG